MARILRRKEFNHESEEPNFLTRVFARFLSWLRNLFPERSPISLDTYNRLSGIAQIVVILLAFSLIVFVVWKFLPRFLREREGSLKLGQRGARVVLGHHIAADKSAAEIMREAEEMARAGELRGAIRKAYIALLCELGDRKVISLAQHRTNRDYLRAVREHESLHATMLALTRSFEAHWYGFAPTATEDWNEFCSGYHNAVRQL
jgi:hypothetical protein